MAIILKGRIVPFKIHIICRNKNPAGKLYNMVMGLSNVFDGLVRLLSLGFFHTDIPITVSRLQVEHMVKNRRI